MSCDDAMEMKQMTAKFKKQTSQLLLNVVQVLSELEKSKTEVVFVKFNRDFYLRYRELWEEYEVQRYKTQPTPPFVLEHEKRQINYTLNIDCLYGQLNHDHPLVTKMEAELKLRYDEARNESTAIDIELKAYEKLNNPFHHEKYLHSLLMQMKISDKECEVDLNPYTNPHSTEHFWLPRQYLTFENIFIPSLIWGLQHDSPNSSDSTFNHTSSSLAVDDRSEREFDGLGVFDPMLQLHPDVSFVENIPEYVGRVLAMRIHQLLKYFPHGITLTKFKEIFESIFYPLEFTESFCSNWYDLVKSLPDICWIRLNPLLPAPLKHLIFPAALQDLVCPVPCMIKRLWHNYLCMLAACEVPIPLEKSWGELIKFLNCNEDLPLSNWGFASTYDFVVYCQKLFDDRNLRIVIPDESDSEPKLFVFFGDDAEVTGFKLYQESREVSGDRRETTLWSRNQRAQLRNQGNSVIRSAPMSWVTDNIVPGQTFLCSRGISRFPYALSMMALEDSMILLALRRKMDKYYDQNLPTARLLLNEKLSPGTVVGALFRKRWRRGIVVNIHARLKMCTVYLMDAAVWVKIEICRLASLPKEFRTVPVLGIPCTLLPSDSEMKKQKYRLQRLRPLPMTTKICTVTFVSREYVDGHSFWTVELKACADEGKARLKCMRRRYFINTLNAKHLKVISHGRRTRGTKSKCTVVSNRVKRNFCGNAPQVPRNVKVDKILRTYGPLHAILEKTKVDTGRGGR